MDQGGQGKFDQVYYSDDSILGFFFEGVKSLLWGSEHQKIKVDLNTFKRWYILEIQEYHGNINHTQLLELFEMHQRCHIGIFI